MPHATANVSLKAHNLHWLDEEGGSSDLCVHGWVEVKIGESILSAKEKGDWCVSAAALYLLRTLTSDHTPEHPVGEHLIPCCGHFMMASEDNADVVIVGCINGIDWDVIHKGRDVLLRTRYGGETLIPFEEWRDVVVMFADEIEAFYQQSATRQPSDDFEAQGYALFKNEWKRRRREFA